MCIRDRRCSCQWPNRCVLSARQKRPSVMSDFRSWVGRLFHTQGPATANQGRRERNVDSRLQIEKKEERCGSRRQSWMKTSALWTMIHWEWRGIGQVYLSNCNKIYLEWASTIRMDEHVTAIKSVLLIKYKNTMYTKLFLNKQLSVKVLISKSSSPSIHKPLSATATLSRSILTAQSK